MLPLLHRFLLFTLLLSGLPVNLQRTAAGVRAAQQEAGPDAVIGSPIGGEALQGSVRISGSASLPGFAGYDLAFAYRGDPRNTWFLIAEKSEPVRNATLAEWDTFQITDGDYDLRLRVFLRDGTMLVHIVEGIRVRNYTIVETSTPAPPATATGTATPDLTAVFTPAATETETPSPTAVPSATPLAPNPAEFRPGAISLSLTRGAAGVLAVFGLLGLYSSLRNARRP